MIPRDHKYYLPFADNWWRLILEMMGVSMTIYFIFMVRTCAAADMHVYVHICYTATVNERGKIPSLKIKTATQFFGKKKGTIESFFHVCKSCVLLC